MEITFQNIIQHEKKQKELLKLFSYIKYQTFNVSIQLKEAVSEFI